MKIKVKDIMPNPFRKIESYPINEEVVVFLMQSIEDLEFWSITGRKHPELKGKYQQAFGHHRIEAARRLKLKEIEFQVINFDDAGMIKAMANENYETNKSPIVINMTVESVKNFLDSELAKYDTWEKCPDRSIKALFTSTKGDFLHAKIQGVGRTTILRFLNGGRKEGGWKRWRIQEALDVLKSDGKDISREAIEEFEIGEQARTFKKAVRDFGIPKEEQKSLVKKIKAQPKRGIREIVLDEAKKKREKEKNVRLKRDLEFKELEEKFDRLDKDSRSLSNFISALKLKLDEIQASEIEGLKSLLILSSLSELLVNIREIVKFFGYNEKNLLLEYKKEGIG